MTTGYASLDAPRATAAEQALVKASAVTVDVRVDAVSPAVVAAGAEVILTGTGFAPSVPENAVTVNGAVASVTGATEAELRFTAPTGILSGPVVVTTPGGTATSATDLFIPPTGFVPTDVHVARRYDAAQPTVTLPSFKDIPVIEINLK